MLLSTKVIKSTHCLKMTHLFLVLFLFLCIKCNVSKQDQCVTYHDPVIINTNIDDEYQIVYNENTQLIFIGYKNIINIYDLNGNKIRIFNVDQPIVSFGVTNNGLLLMTTQPNNTIYIYNTVNGTLIKTIDVCGYNQNNYILVNRITGEFYVVYDIGWIWDLYSFDRNQKLIAFVHF